MNVLYQHFDSVLNTGPLTPCIYLNLWWLQVMQGNLTAVLSAAGNYCQTVWDGALHHVAFIIDGGPKVQL